MLTSVLSMREKQTGRSESLLQPIGLLVPAPHEGYGTGWLQEPCERRFPRCVGPQRRKGAHRARWLPTPKPPSHAEAEDRERPSQTSLGAFTFRSARSARVIVSKTTSTLT